MSAEHPQPSLADVLSAVAAELGDGAAHRIHRAACQLMWKRLIASNLGKIGANVASLRDARGAEHAEIQRRLGALLLERERLHTAAYGQMPSPIEVRP